MTTATLPGDYYDRTDETKNYERHLFFPSRPLQSAEMNEIQSSYLKRVKNLGDKIFKDGDVLSGAALVINGSTATASVGDVYINGAVRNVPQRSFTVSLSGDVFVGIWIIETVVDESSDSLLLDPAIGAESFGEAGAMRLKVQPQWGLDSDSIGNAEFFFIYKIVDGQLVPKEAPPQSELINQAIANYDIDSTGSNYVVSGMRVRALDDDAGDQVYVVGAGRSRVSGRAINLSADFTVRLTTAPDRRLINSEPHISATNGIQRINVNRAPAAGAFNIVGVKRTSDLPMTRGTFAGTEDAVSGVTISAIESVVQGIVTYVAGRDYVLSPSGKISWAPSGGSSIEPAPGSSYTMTYLSYEVFTSPDVTAPDAYGFYIENAVAGQTILVSYDAALPRIDRLCMTPRGEFIWKIGVSSESNPVPPQIPSDSMALAQIVHDWGDQTRRVVLNDGIRMISMLELDALIDRMDLLTDLVAEQRLISSINSSQSSASLGIFVDSFVDDSRRDGGITQTAATVGGALTLPISAPAPGVVLTLDADITTPAKISSTDVVVLSQTLVTGVMKINPYDAFDTIPAIAVLSPAVDNWTEVVEDTASPVTIYSAETSAWYGYRVYGISGPIGGGQFWSPAIAPPEKKNVLIKTAIIPKTFLRELDVGFVISGFGAGEILNLVTFDGVDITSTVV